MSTSGPCNSYPTKIADTDVGNTAHSEQALWEEILKQHGLSTNQGSSPSWLTYGWEYRDSHKPIQYGGGSKRPNKKTSANLIRAKKLLEQMATGLSMKKAARILGIPQQTAVYILKKHREVSTLPTIPTPIEGN